MNQEFSFPKPQAAEVAGIPVIGLGGSAGSLTSLESFFAAMPKDSGAAFVIIQHVSPNHKSLLPELLAAHTKMRVLHAVDAMHVEPNCVYIIPPNYYLGLRNGTLFLADPAPDYGRHMPVDFFFRTLADDREHLGVGILFSGMGTDGTFGARAIRGAGGLVVAQDPATAQFGDMPRSAVAAGLADYVLAPAYMPQVVQQYLQHPYVKGATGTRLIDINEYSARIREILSLVLDQTGNDFRCYKPATMSRRVGRRMGLLHVANTANYLALLHRDPGEIKLLLKDLLINVTAFFRDKDAFDELRDKVLASLAEAKKGDEPLRIWVPACATGEEAYSLAILLMEQRAKFGKTCSLRVFATDLDEEALEVARSGFYPENIVGDIGKEYLASYFVRKENGFQVKDSLREILTFAAQNVITDPPFSKMDLISCRNLLIYLNADAQAKLMALFNFSLKPGGYLFLGRSETVAGQSDLFEAASKKARIYRRLTPTRPLLLDSPILPGKRRMIMPGHTAGGMHVASNFADAIRLEILKHFGASAVLIDRKGSVLQFHGQTERFLNLPAPGPNFNVFDLAKENLPTKLRLAVHKAVQDDKPVIVDNVSCMYNGVPAFVRVTVVPVAQRIPLEPLLVVFFEDAAGPATSGAEVIQIPENEAAVKRLEDELRATQQDLQATIQELQSSNEELRAANEEVMSTNEELESTNEELVSSTEELQSTNEELTTVINQLQEKVDLLEQARAERKKAEDALRVSEERFRALVESSPNAVLLAKRDGMITFVNSQAEVMFGYPRNELIGQAVETLVPERFRTKHPGYRGQFAARPEKRPMGAGRDLFAARKDGTEFPAEIGLTPLDMPEGPATLVTITDITIRQSLAPKGPTP
jgi:two-component system CheB/CheR fusion protein